MEITNNPLEAYVKYYELDLIYNPQLLIEITDTKIINHSKYKLKFESFLVTHSIILYRECDLIIYLIKLYKIKEPGIYLKLAHIIPPPTPKSLLIIAKHFRCILPDSTDQNADWNHATILSYDSAGRLNMYYYIKIDLESRTAFNNLEANWDYLDFLAKKWQEVVEEVVGERVGFLYE